MQVPAKRAKSAWERLARSSKKSLRSKCWVFGLKKCQPSISHDWWQLQIWNFQRCCNAVQTRDLLCVNPVRCYCVGSRASYANSKWLPSIEPRVQRHISRVTAAISLKLAEALHYSTNSEYLECELVWWSMSWSRAMLYNSLYGHHLALCGQKSTARAAVRNGRYDYIHVRWRTRRLLLLRCWCGVVRIGPSLPWRFPLDKIEVSTLWLCASDL